VPMGVQWYLVEVCGVRKGEDRYWWLSVSFLCLTSHIMVLDPSWLCLFKQATVCWLFRSNAVQTGRCTQMFYGGKTQVDCCDISCWRRSRCSTVQLGYSIRTCYKLNCKGPVERSTIIFFASCNESTSVLSYCYFRNSFNYSLHVVSLRYYYSLGYDR
jgi:hypothetical protein